MNSVKMLLEFRNRGFELVESNVRGITLLYKIEEELADVCIVVDNSANVYFTGQQLESIGDQVERKFLLGGFKSVEIMFLVISNYPERDKLFVHYELKFWILDTTSNRILIYEDQPEDYVHIREALEGILNDTRVPEKRKIQRFPIVNLSLIAINIIVFIVMELLGSTENTAFMLHHGAAFGEYIFNNKEYYRLFTSIFIHFGSYHLINNMIVLLLVGNKVEQALGKIKFLLIYVLSGMGGSLISAGYYFMKEQLVISGGASGAIFGIIGSLVILMIKDKRKSGNILSIQFLLLIAIILYNGFISTKIDTIAHLAGLLFGMLVTHIITSMGKSVRDS